MRNIIIGFIILLIYNLNLFATLNWNFTNKFYFINQNTGGNDNSIYNEPVKNYTYRANLTQLSIHFIKASNLQNIDSFNIDGKLNFNYTDSDIYFNTSYFKIYNNSNIFTIGYLPLKISPIIINRNDIFGIKWNFKFTPINILEPFFFDKMSSPIEISVCGGKLNDGVYYPRYLLGGSVKLNLYSNQLEYHYYNVFDQKSEQPIGEITEDKFSLSQNNVVKVYSSKQQGVIRKNININLDDYPDLAIRIVDVGDKKLCWSMDVNDGIEQITIQPPTSDTGKLNYNLKALTKWSGSKTILITITVYNYLYDLKDNGLYIDWIKIYNSETGEVFWQDEYFDNWMKENDTEIVLINKDDLFKYLPEDIYDKKYTLHSFIWRKRYGKFTGNAEISFNTSKIRPNETLNGFAFNSYLNYKLSKEINLLSENIIIDKNFNIKPLIGYPSINRDLKDYSYFYFGYTDLMGDWTVDRATIIPKTEGIEIAGKGGYIYKEIEVNLDLYPYLSIDIDGNIDRDFEWALYVIDDNGNEIMIQSPISQKGIFSYNISEKTGWHGIKKFKIKIVKGEDDIKILWVKFWHLPVVKDYILNPGEKYSDLNIKYNKNNIMMSCKFSGWGDRYKNYSVKLFIKYLWFINKNLNINFYELFEHRKGKEIKDIWSYPIYSDSEINNNKPGVKVVYFYNNMKLIEGKISYLFNIGKNQINNILFDSLQFNFPLKVFKLIYNVKNVQGKFLNETHYRIKHSIKLEKRINIFFDTYCDINYNFNLFFNKKNNLLDYQQHNITINFIEKNFLGIKNSQIYIKQELNYVEYLNQAAKYNSYILKMGSMIVY